MVCNEYSPVFDGISTWFYIVVAGTLLWHCLSHRPVPMFVTGMCVGLWDTLMSGRRSH